MSPDLWKAAASIVEEWVRSHPEAGPDDVVRLARQTMWALALPAQPSGLAGRNLAELEREAILGTLAMTDGDRRAASTLLGIGERTVYRKLAEYGITDGTPWNGSDIQDTNRVPS
jgi:DNA-binding NtrC family response regulator